MKQIVRLTESDLHHIIKETIATISLNESFDHYQSPKLVTILKKHGISDSAPMTNHYLLTQLRDDNIEGVSDRKCPMGQGGRYGTKLGDGTYLIYNINNNQMAQKIHNSSNKDVANIIRPNNEMAGKNLPSNVDPRFNYVPMTTRSRDARELRYNPYFKQGKNKPESIWDNNGEWNQKRSNKIMNNLRAGKDKNGNENRPMY